MGLTQIEMAERLGVGARAYSAWESGASRPGDVIRLAEVLEGATGIDRAWWLGWNDTPGGYARGGLANTQQYLPGADQHKRAA